MIIAQISDTHIGLPGELPEGVDTRKNLQAALDDACAAGADHLILTGDLAWRYGEAGIYSWIARQLAETGLPWDAVPGNHDSLDLMRRHLGLCSGGNGYKYFLAKKLGPFRAILLDTGNGEVGTAQTAWLASQLAAKNDRSVATQLLFLHHPPVIGHNRYLDARYALKDGNILLDLLAKDGNDWQVFFGHYHMEKTVISGNSTCHFSPSTYFQIDPESENFKKDIASPGYRLIRLGEDDSLQTEVRRF